MDGGLGPGLPAEDRDRGSSESANPARRQEQVNKRMASPDRVLMADSGQHLN